MLNLQAVNSLQEAQNRQWIFMENLKHSVQRVSIIYSNNQLLVVGGTVSTAECKHVQYLNLATNITGVHADTIGCGNANRNRPGLYTAGMYSVEGGKVSIFGGGRAYREFEYIS